jgi:hypothetical protein
MWKTLRAPMKLTLRQRNLHSGDLTNVKEGAAE